MQKLMKNLVCIDTETTGLNKATDHIIQLSAVKINPETYEELGVFDHYIIPYGKDFTITESAQEIHGLSKEFILETGSYLREVAQEFIDFISGCDILTYNGNTFDIGFIEKDFSEIGFHIDWSQFNSIDSYMIECALNSRKLADVYRRYTGEEMVVAHNALFDIRATIEVFKHQEPIANVTPGLKYINKIISPENTVQEDGDKLVMCYGKYRLWDVYEVCKTDPGYIKWLFGTGISSTTKKAIQNYYDKRKNS